MNTFKRLFGTCWWITIGMMIGQVGAKIYVWRLAWVAGLVTGSTLVWMTEKTFWFNLATSIGAFYAVKAFALVLRVIGGLSMQTMMRDVMFGEDFRQAREEGQEIDCRMQSNSR